LAPYSRDHAARAQVQPELHGNENDGKQNAHERHRQADAIVKQIAKGKGKDHGVGSAIHSTWRDLKQFKAAVDMRHNVSRQRERKYLVPRAAQHTQINY
jgi:hypothetical protein